MIVARPRAVPIPLPLIAFGPTRLNLSMKIILAESNGAHGERVRASVRSAACLGQ